MIACARVLCERHVSASISNSFHRPVLIAGAAPLSAYFSLSCRRLATIIGVVALSHGERFYSFSHWTRGPAPLSNHHAYIVVRHLRTISVMPQRDDNRRHVSEACKTGTGFGRCHVYFAFKIYLRYALRRPCFIADTVEQVKLPLSAFHALVSACTLDADYSRAEFHANIDTWALSLQAFISRPWSARGDSVARTRLALFSLGTAEPGNHYWAAPEPAHIGVKPT